MWISAAAILLAGWLIGATSIGGVLVVPVLHEMQGVECGYRDCSRLAGFGVSWDSSALALERGSSSPATGNPVAALGFPPGAFVGALLLQHINLTWLLAGIGGPCPAKRRVGPARPASIKGCSQQPLGSGAMLLIGCGVGLGSALSGTGGPVLLVPVLMFARQPLPAIVINAQAVQLPIALCAGASHALSGALDYRLALRAWVMLLGALDTEGPTPSSCRRSQFTVWCVPF